MEELKELCRTILDDWKFERDSRIEYEFWNGDSILRAEYEKMMSETRSLYNSRLQMIEGV